MQFTKFVLFAVAPLALAIVSFSLLLQYLITFVIHVQVQLIMIQEQRRNTSAMSNEEILPPSLIDLLKVGQASHKIESKFGPLVALIRMSKGNLSDLITNAE
jgi:uncharacterized membrane protein